MINLLPPELKQDYRYARYNRHLARWAIILVLALVGSAVLTASGLLVMNNSIDTYKTRNASAQASLVSQDATDTERQVSTISNNLSLMVDVLSKEILFSKLLEQLGSITPPNVILTGLSISQDQSAIDITAEASNYNAATQLQINLADPANQIFSSADIVNITCATGNAITNQNYPCTATLRAQFAKNNPFLFINSKAVS